MDNRYYSDLGRQIRNMVEDAVNSGDFSQLNKNIGDTIGDAVDTFTGRKRGFDYKTPYGTTDGETYRRKGRQDTYRENTYREQSQSGTGTYREAETRSGTGTYRSPFMGQTFTGQPFEGEAKRPAASKTSSPAAVRKKSRKDVPGRISGVLLTVFGWIVFGAMALTFLIMGIAALAADSYGFLGRFSAWLILPLAAAGLGMAWRGSVLRGRAKRYRIYLDKLEGRSYASIKELAAAGGKTDDSVQKDIRKMMSSGLLPGARFDDEGTSLILNEEAYAQYLKMKEGQRLKAEEDAAKAAAEPETEEERQLRLAIEEGQEYIRKIRALNDDIPGEEISRKLDRTELILQKIFACLAGHPEQLPEMKKFMGYYLPTTLKLVEAYREFDQQPVEGGNIAASKREIEKTMDTINEAFENLLDDLFQDAAWDISSDISVLKTMLAQEGLTDDGVHMK